MKLANGHDPIVPANVSGDYVFLMELTRPGKPGFLMAALVTFAGPPVLPSDEAIATESYKDAVLAITALGGGAGVPEGSSLRLIKFKRESVVQAFTFNKPGVQSHSE